MRCDVHARLDAVPAEPRRFQALLTADVVAVPAAEVRPCHPCVSFGFPHQLPGPGAVADAVDGQSRKKPRGGSGAGRTSL
eukprot:14195705-Heterocapsa_arctica.AAC.1